MKWLISFTGIIFLLLLAGLLFAPVPIEPVAWDAPPNPGLKGPYKINTRLAWIQKLPLYDTYGPEAIAIDAAGRIYAGTHDGVIVRFQNETTRPKKWSNTGGRPLGMKFDANGNLIVADAYRGLLSILPDGHVSELAVIADGIPIRYADDLDIADDGRIYFSDASVKFGAEAWGGTLEASYLDIAEHGGHGRLLVYDPETGNVATLLDGINFANGVAVSHDQMSVLVVETGTYRVLRHWIRGPRNGVTEPFIEALPSFPDNISRGSDGIYWIALVSPRNPLLDRFADKPFIRKIAMRLPEALRPRAVPYGHIIAVNEAGVVIENLQDPNAAAGMNTSVTETDDHLYIGSLTTDFIARLPKSRITAK
jgi:sugar lactone lactonase YvrE